MKFVIILDKRCYKKNAIIVTCGVETPTIQRIKTINPSNSILRIICMTKINTVIK